MSGLYGRLSIALVRTNALLARSSSFQWRIQQLVAGGRGTGEGVVGGGAKPHRGGCGRGAPARGSGGAL